MSEINPTIEETLLVIRKIRQNGGRVSVADDKLKLDLPKALNNQQFLQELRRHKVNILSLFSEEIDASPANMPIPTCARVKSMPLSYGQERFWLLEQLSEGVSPFYIPLGLRLKGKLSLVALEQGFNKIIDRHETLRTGFLEEMGVPYATVTTEIDFRVEVCDIRSQNVSIATRQHLPELHEFLHRPFDLSHPPLMRACVFQESELSQVLVVVFHHMVADGWSLGIFLEELAAFYNNVETETPLQLNTLPVQYLDYVSWQQSEEQKEVQEKGLNFWLEELADLPSVLELPTDYFRPNKLTYDGGNLPFSLEPALFQKLEQLSQQEGVTLFAILQTALQVLLYRYTQQPDFAIGTAVANRARLEIEGLLGLFTNMLALRAKVSTDETLAELLQTTQQTTLSAMSHQDTPFERLVEEINPERQLGVNPLYQVLLLLQNADISLPQFTGLRSEFVELRTETALLDLVFELWVDEGSLLGTIEYNRALFKEETVARMIMHFKVILKALSENLALSINQIQMLDDKEYHVIVHQWNETEVTYDHAPTPDLFHYNAAKSPNAVAATCAENKISYRELDERSNQWAHYLHHQGVIPNSLVGLAVDRSIMMVEILLGIWKAGGAYVPLDPAYPTNRLAHMITDSGMEILVSEGKHQADLPPGEARLLIYEEIEMLISSQPKTPLELTLNPEDLAYVIYTSGSTGLPKGVKVPHRALTNFLWSMQREPGLTSDDILASVTTLSFDIHGLELWLPLITGAQIVIITPDVSTDGMRLAQLLDTCEATMMQATPATWKLLLDSDWNGRSQLKMLCGGEPLPSQLADQLLEKGGELWNMYGPTETTIWSSVAKIEKERDLITIGRPIANTQMYVLDDYLQPVPVGMIGLLYIGGDGVTHGYLNKDELTRTRFIDNPFGAGQIYNTGDLARFRKDGQIECLGRVDSQVKVRGFRIELGEIDAQVSNYDGIEDAVSTVFSDGNNGNRIVSYYRGENEFSYTELRDFLNGSLPYYMIPSMFMKLDIFPLTPNGKIDRRALPKPDSFSSQSTGEFTAPQTEIEITLAEIWSNILENDKIGVHDNFFELGGHSLLATRVINRIFDRYGIRISLLIFFQSATIESLSTYIEDELEQENTDVAIDFEEFTL